MISRRQILTAAGATALAGSGIATTKFFAAHAADARLNPALPEGLRGLRYFFGGVARNDCGALEAEESARLVAGFDDAVGEKGELCFRR